VCEDEGPLCPKGETKSGVTHKNQVSSNNGSKGCNKRKWGQGKSKPQGDKTKLVGKNPPSKENKKKHFQGQATHSQLLARLKIVGYFLDWKMTNSFMIPQVTKWLGVKTKLVVDPITVQLAQGITRPSFNVVLNFWLFCRGVQFVANFTLCDVDNFDVILQNTFLDAYKVDFLCSGGK